IAIHRDEDRVAPAAWVAGEWFDAAGWQRLSIEERLVTGDLLEAQVVVELEGPPLVPQPVQPGDQRLDVPPRVPVPRADLVLLAAGVLLPVLEAPSLAQLEARVDPPRWGAAGGQHRSDHEGRAAVVQMVGKDVRRVRPEVAAEVLAHRCGGQLGQVITQRI